MSQFYSLKIAEYAIRNNDKICKCSSSYSILEVEFNLRRPLMIMKFVDCALNANADYIVTNDKLFNVLKEFDFQLKKVIDILPALKNILGL